MTTMPCRAMVTSTMRSVLTCLVLTPFVAGCLGGGGGRTRPAVLNSMTEQPHDPEKRDAVLGQAHSTAGPEHRKGFTPKMRRVETTAATAAAWIGHLLSDHENTFLGTATTFDEGELLAPIPEAPKADGKASDDEKPVEPLLPADDAELVPWVKLKKD